MIPAYCINLDHDAARWHWSRAQFARHGVTLQRHAAVLGAALPQDRRLALLARVHPAFRMGPVELGCLLSHIEVWKRVAPLGEAWAFVCEDDLHLADDAGAYLGDAGWLPPWAGIVKPETTFKPCALSRDAAPLPGGRRLHRLLSLHGGAGGYFIRGHAAARALALIEHSLMPVDLFLFGPDITALQDSVALAQVAPALCVQEILLQSGQGPQGSNIGPERDALRARRWGLRWGGLRGYAAFRAYKLASSLRKRRARGRADADFGVVAFCQTVTGQKHVSAGG